MKSGCRDTPGRLGCNVQGAIKDREIPSPFRENILPLAESANPALKDIRERAIVARALMLATVREEGVAICILLVIIIKALNR